MAEFTHLHVHTEYSLLDGLTTPEELAEIVSTNGQVASAITDHGTMGGFLRFQKSAKEFGIKPVFGVEAYFVDDVDNDGDDKAERFHLILLAKNDIGLRNLFGINKVAWTDQFYYKPRIDFETITRYSDGIICLSGCMGSSLSKALRDDDMQRADWLIRRFMAIYGEDYYIEIQPHNPPELNAKLISCADAYGVKLVGTLDCHFQSKDKAGTEEVLLVCGQQAGFKGAVKRHADEHFSEACAETDLIKKMDILYPDRKLSFKDLPLYVMDANEVVEHFANAGITRQDILENSMEIAEKCNAEIKLGGLYLPNFTKEAKIKMHSNEYLEEIAFFMLKELKLDKNEVYVARLKEELEVIMGKNFSDYFLLLWDLVQWAKDNDIAMGTARGSAAGSLLAYVLGITKVDPIKYGLLFFRFLNPERNDFPDIDLDFEDRRRDEVKEYLRVRWGEDRVAGVAAYGTFQPRASVKSVASALNVPYREANYITSAFNTLDEYESAKSLEDFRKKYPAIIDIARDMEGRIKTASAHAAGIVVSSVPLEDIVPIEVRKEANTGRMIRVIAYDKDECQDFGLIKLDPLSLKAATVVKDCINIIKERHGVDVEAQSWDVDNEDPRIYEEITKGNVVGIFQLEGGGYTNLINDMKGLHNFNDLVASNALVRPGSFDTQGDTYLAVRDGLQEAKYDHEILRNILEESHGTYIYEEQVMRIAVELAGFSWGKADRLRKIISKKLDPVAFKAYEKDFIEGGSKHIDEEKVQALWNNIEKASTYMFNKSHSTAYSLMSYQTMWLKVNYPLEFMWATLFNEDKPEKVTTYIFEAKRMGIPIEGPDINSSGSQFSINGDALQFGISNVAGVGESAIKEILAKRPFDSFEEFRAKCAKNKVKVNVVEAMEKVGCFESIGHAPYEKERYYGPLLNFPINSESIYDELIESCHDASTIEGIHIIRGIVKSTKRTATYFRVEIEDASGTYTGFANMDKTLSKRDYIIAMVGDNSLMHFEDFNQLDQSDSKFARFLRDQIEDNPNPYEEVYKKGLEPGLNVGRMTLAYLMSASRFTNKKGNEMCRVYFYIPEHGMVNLMLFGHQLDKLASELEGELEWKMLKLVPSKKGDGYYINEMHDVRRFCRMRGIILDTV